MLAGIDDEPSFTRSMIVNTTENIQTIIQASQYLTDDYVTQKILEYLGDGDKIQEMLKQMDQDDMNRFAAEDEEGNASPNASQNESSRIEG